MWTQEVVVGLNPEQGPEWFKKIIDSVLSAAVGMLPSANNETRRLLILTCYEVCRES